MIALSLKHTHTHARVRVLTRAPTKYKLLVPQETKNPGPVACKACFLHLPVRFSDPSPALSAPLHVADWGFVIRQLLCHVIVAAGLVGNCLSFFVMKSKPLRHKSYSHYLW